MSEIVEQQLSERDARRLTERIRFTAQTYTDAKEKLIRLVQEAKDGSAHEVLGYPSWTAYLAETLGDEPMRLARDERQEMVKVLSSEGLSVRAISAITDTPRSTVSDYQRSPGVRNRTPEPKSDAELLAGAEWTPPVEEDEPRFTDEPGRVQPVTGTITGMDGKEYQRPQPQEPYKQRRNPLPDQARTAGWEVRKSVERIERILEDDRFARNKEEVAAHLRGHLQYAIETLQTTLDQIN